MTSPPRPPRRFRRRLLLPPGWLALGWLLLLGCGLLQAHWQQLQPMRMIPLTMFPLKQDTTGLADYQRFSHSADSPYTTPYQSPAELEKLRLWHNAELRGCSLADFLNTAAVESNLRAIQTDSAHAGGVRVRLLPGATYANLVAVLNIMDFTNQKKYWLDTRYRPVTLYALTVQELPRDPDADMYVSCGYHPTPPLPPSGWQQWLNSWQQGLTALRQPAWRLPWLVLAALGSLSAYRLALRARSS